MSGDPSERVWKHLEERQRQRDEWERAANQALWLGFAAGLTAGAIIAGAIIFSVVLA